MKVRIFKVSGTIPVRILEVGTLELQGGQVVAVGATPDDRRFLAYLASRPISVLIDQEMRTLTAADHPEAFLQWMHRHYSGSALRASAAEE